MKYKIIIDFNEKYDQSKLKYDEILISHTKKINSNRIFNVTTVDFDRTKAFELYEKSLEGLKVVDFINFNAHRPNIFRSFFIPFYKWIVIINNLIDEGYLNKDTDIVFTSLSNNNKIFFLEAEGESQSNFLYKKSYFLSSYVKKYILSKEIANIHYKKNDTFKAKLSFFFRGFVFIFMKFFQQIIYKFYNLLFVKKNKKLNKNIIATRGIIQSQFFNAFKNILNENTFSILVNESSIFPFRNLKYFKKNKIKHIYAEGNISTVKIFKCFLLTFKNYFFKCFLNNHQKISFCDVDIYIYDMLPELYIYEYFSETQGLTLSRTLKQAKDKNLKQIFCFDMLTPQPFYVKKYTNLYVHQIQTTLMQPLKQDNFVYGDNFFFTDKDTFEKHSIINKEFNDKFDLLDNLKYSSLNTKTNIKAINVLTFFTQPIFINEELFMINFIKKWAADNNYKMSIKLHPRSKKAHYDSLKLPILNSDISSIEIIKNTDLVITRNSSIGLDSWLLNTPMIFLTYGQLKSDNISYIPKNYKGNFKNKPSNESLNKFIENLDSYFYKHPYLTSNNVDVESIIKKLNF